MNRAPAPELVRALEPLRPGKALDLACGAGRHTVWLRERGWDVTAVDRSDEFPGAIHADLELGEFAIEPGVWDLIVCWLYWQPDLLASIAGGVSPGGVVAMAGKISGRFAVKLDEMRAAFPGWREIASGDGSSGENQVRCFLIVEKPVD